MKRRYDIDWLRVLIMLTVFLFHCARFFAGGAWHLNNDTQSFAALILLSWLEMWFMPLFFVLSGVGSWYALKSRTGGQYVLERIKRILVPLFTVGFVVLLPPQFYFEKYSNAGFTGTIWQSLPIYLSGVGRFRFSSPGGLLPLPFVGHLWFLWFLFLSSLLALALLLYLRSKGGRGVIEKLAELSIRPGGIFLFLIPVILVRIALRSFFYGENTWADFFEYLVLFVLGYILPANGNFTEGIKKHGWICLVLGLVAYGVRGFFIMGLGYNYPGGEPFSLMFVTFEAVMGIGRWSWIVFVLSLGAKYLNTKNKFLAYGNEAVLPFYIFHQTVILCVGLVRNSMGCKSTAEICDNCRCLVCADHAPVRGIGSAFQRSTFPLRDEAQEEVVR
jgi:hypothetical protein